MTEENQGNALKAISKTEKVLRVANYIVLFGDEDHRDLEGIASPRKNADGSAGEFFTADTQFESDYTATGTLYMDWEHGLKLDKVGPGRDDILGYVDWKSARVDDTGVWAERVLNRSRKYMSFVEKLIDAGILSTSSEAMMDGAKKTTNGEWLVWPLRRDTLTVTPMEPRMMDDNTLVALKALSAEFPYVESLAKAIRGLETEAEAGSEESAPTVTAAQVDVNINIVTDAKAEVIPDAPEGKAQQDTTEETMSDNENVSTETKQAPPAVDYEAMIAKAVADASAAAVKSTAEQIGKLWEQKLADEPAINGAGVVTITDGRADRELKANPFKSLGEFAMAVAQAGKHGQYDDRLHPLRSSDPADDGGFSLGKALGPEFVGSLTKSSLYGKAITGMSETVGADGGYFVGTDRSAGLLARVYDVGQLLQRVSMVGVSGQANGMTFLAEDETSRVDGSRRGGVRAYWAAEAAQYTASQPQFREMELRLRKVIGLVYATDELLADAGALESYILQTLPEELRFVVEDAIVNGTGAGQPLGFLQGGDLISVAKETGQAAASVTSGNVMDVWARMYAPSRRNAVWFTDQTVEPQLMQLTLDVGTAGIPLWTPPGGLSGAPYGTILGRPVIAYEYGAAVGSVGDIVFADMSQYQAIEKGGMESASSMHLRFDYGEQVFRFSYRVDGQPKFASALTPNSGGDTLASFISLAERA